MASTDVNNENAGQENVKKRRFAVTSSSEKEKIREERNAKNTNRATSSSIAILQEYIAENTLTPLDEVPNCELPQLLENFYADACTKKNFDRYKTGSFKSIRSNMNRYFKEKRGINICADSAFNNANLMVFFVFFKVFGGHMSFFGATGTPVLDFWWRLLWVSKPEWVLPYSLFLRRRM